MARVSEEEEFESIAPETSLERAEQGRAQRVLYILALLVSLIGLSDAIYLTVHHLTGQSLRCTVTSGCDEVLNSSYAAISGIPLAAFGALAYFTVFSLSTLALFGYKFARNLLAVVVAIMLAMTLWLLYLQAFVIGHYCQYCLLSAACTLALTAIVATDRFISPVNKIKEGA